MTYVDVPYEEWLREELQLLDLSPPVRDHITTMARLHKQNRYDRVTHDVAEILGRPPSGFGSLVSETPVLRDAARG